MEVGQMGTAMLWEPLQMRIRSHGDGSKPTEADGIAAAHAHPARFEAARKLITNHEMVLGDVTNPSPQTQHELRRVDVFARHYADEALRELARRLLGLSAGDEPIPELRADPHAPAQVEARAAVAQYLDGRIQATPQQKPGRQPDMSMDAAAAMKAVR